MKLKTSAMGAKPDPVINEPHVFDDSSVSQVPVYAVILSRAATATLYPEQCVRVQDVDIRASQIFSIWGRVGCVDFGPLD